MNNLTEMFDRCMPVTESGCWIWLGAVNHNGYGILRKNRKTYRAHRFAFELYAGPLQRNILVCHTCDVRCCVNPDHLFLGTSRDNVLDMMAKGKIPGGGPRNKREGIQCPPQS